MTVGELIQALREFEPSKEVVVDHEAFTHLAYPVEVEETLAGAYAVIFLDGRYRPWVED